MSRALIGVSASLRIDRRFAAVFSWFVSAARRRRDQLRGRRLSVS
jgi:hypothetical protein